MKITYKKATERDCEELIRINNEAYRSDYLRYGECPGYHISMEQMRESTLHHGTDKYLILADGMIVGAVSVVKKSETSYYLGNICIVPNYQHRGIGQKTISFVLNQYPDLEELALVTPADKEENVRFYTEKCGFKVTGNKMDGNVRVATFLYKR